MDSTETGPAPPIPTDQPPVGLESEEGELKLSPVVRRKKLAAKQKGGDPRTGNKCHIENREATEEGESNRDRSKIRSDRNKPTQIQTSQKREQAENTEEEARIRKRQRLPQCLAELPSQPLGASASMYKGMKHKHLPMRSMEEDCSAAEQHRCWINNMPCRRTEILPEIESWIKHFEKGPNTSH